MLTDIFANRYPDAPTWKTFEERDRRFIVQAFRIIEEQLFPPYNRKGETIQWINAKWKAVHDRLTTELGRHLLGEYRPYMSWHQVCKGYVCKQFEPQREHPDQFVKNRLSFFEIAFREKENDLARQRRESPNTAHELMARLVAKGGTPPPSGQTFVDIEIRKSDAAFRNSVYELNTRLMQAAYELNYHNGFIQIAEDEVVERQIETPFWTLVSDAKWANVDTDMKEALDLRDSGGRNPAWHAAKALESAIKIISDEKAWTHGGEKGPHNYIDNLASKKNGRFIDAWEATTLKQFFTDVRNPFGHGAGSDEMPKLSDQQTNWAIAFCMAWVRSLAERA